MVYIGRRMSVNAYEAYKRGLLPKSKITRKQLNEKGWEYSLAFFYWLCKQRYITPKEYHHTTPKFKSTAFYDLNSIDYINEKYDLESLYKVYLNKCTLRDILNQKSVSRVRILVSRKLMRTKSDVVLDCLRYNKLYWWSKTRTFWVNSKDVRLIKVFDLDDFVEWKNPNRAKLERQICMRKKYFRSPDKY